MEAAVRAAAEGAGARFRAFWSNTLCHLEDLPFRLQQLPQNFGGSGSGPTGRRWSSLAWRKGEAAGGGARRLAAVQRRSFLPWLAASLRLSAACL